MAAVRGRVATYHDENFTNFGWRERFVIGRFKEAIYDVSLAESCPAISLSK